MMTFLLFCTVIFCFGFAFDLFSFFLKAFILIFLKLPAALILGMFGITFCCTIILIPVGVLLIKCAITLVFS